MGKRFTESAAKKAAGLARKRNQAHAKQREEMEQLEAEEASKWEEGSKRENARKLEEEQKKQEKIRAKKERDALLAAEEQQLGKGGKGKRRLK
ncbi:Lso2p SKDI_07G4220 [Saccharomyces kudriavzevii IFO 1802]|uniref:LSO1/LSO2 domain-containing protein n=1 Tax=Saccharomyces kudriavzevii (strain ATCC MYA-4449 / AS 2.2408 / CBS 8840 / NBRC 1802 / NCYC 2889) TaxID=226230 RepID=A0AA35JKM8_SACK1|nr:uncharacterized protein SKDI_07G4220 [Saccharomyces kudriavzevii IFO 1802]CAI4062676.1 hypothetical protein SKDI_07G4220 [Saccharomyces kudriavzevii IFO 1802]